MPEGVCSSRIPIQYTFLHASHKGYLDTHTNIIYSAPADTDCNMANNIPLIWNEQYHLYHRDGNLTQIKSPPLLHWSPYADSDLQLTASGPTFHQLILYNISDFQNLAAEDREASRAQQAAVLHDLGLRPSTKGTAHDAKMEFASNIVTYGLFGFLYGMVPSLTQLWMFLVCVGVTAYAAFSCCCRPCFRRAKPRYQQFALTIKQSTTRLRPPRQRRKGSPSQSTTDIQTPDMTHTRDGTGQLGTTITAHCPPAPFGAGHIATGTFAPMPYIPLYPQIMPRSATPLDTSPMAATANSTRPAATIATPTTTTYTRPIYVAGMDARSLARVQTCIPVQIGRKTMIALWDTGSEISIIATKACRKLGLWDKVQKTRAVATSVCSRDIHFKGQVLISFVLAGEQCSQQFHVWDHSPFDVILGTDLMKHCPPASIDHANKQFWFDGLEPHAVALVSERPPCPPVPVELTEDVTIPPRTIAYVRVRCRSALPITGVSAQFDGDNYVANNAQVVLPAVVAQIDDSHLPVAINNHTQRPTTVRAHTILGTVVKLHDNPHVAVLAQASGINDAEAPIGQAEAQFDDIAQGQQDAHGDTCASPPWLDNISWKTSILTTAQQLILLNLIISFQSIFSSGPTDIGRTHLVKHDIDVGNAKPIFQRQYRIPHAFKPLVKEQLQRLLSAGVISESNSPWNSPMVVVRKKTDDGSLKIRCCLDLRGINKLIKLVPYAMPRITDIMDSLGNAKYISVLDMKDAYNAIELTERSKDITSFQIPAVGKFRYERLPFGIASAGFQFQQLVEMALDTSRSPWVYSYLDDVIVFSSTFEQHIEHLTDVFTKLHNAGIKLSPHKCQFCQQEVTYLGHLLTPNGMKPINTTIDKIKRFPAPTSSTETKAFLGLVGFYRRFIRNFAAIANPLHQLLQKGVSFTWTAAHQTAFECLKAALHRDVLLAYPDFDEPFIVATDASTLGIGGVLSQLHNGTERPIAFYSRALRTYEKNYTVSELEALAVVESCKTFDVYLHGKPFTLLTDHSALQQIFHSKNPSPKLVRWALALQHLDMTVKYRKGANNGNADALSRMRQATPEPSARVTAITRVLPELSAIREAQAQDPWIGTTIQWLQNKSMPGDTRNNVKQHIQRHAADFFVHRDMLYYAPGGTTKRLVIPPRFTAALITEYHDAPWGGHFSAEKTLSRLTKFYFWRGMHQQVSAYCRKCLPCQLRKTPTSPTKQPLKPWPTTATPLARVSVDIFGPVRQSTHGNTVVLVTTDFLTRFVWTQALPNQKAHTLAQALVKLFLQIGFPAELLSDSGTNFLANVIKEVCAMLNINKLTAAPLNQKANGLTERFMATLANGISHYTDQQQTNWCEHVPFITFAHNVAAQKSVGESPFYLLYHRDAQLPIDQLLSHKVSVHAEQPTVADETALHVQLAWDNARTNLQHTQQRQKQRYDKTARASRITVGSQVLIKDTTIRPQQSKKLTYPYKGPYRCVRIEGNNLFLTPIRQPAATPFRWHIDQAKLATVPMEESSQTPPPAATNRPPKPRYPLHAPAQHRHNLRSKMRAT